MAPRIDVRDFGARVTGSSRCAEGASALVPTAPDQAWQLLRACVDGGDFTELRAFLSGMWDRELLSRPDAPDLLARVVAMRGGGVQSDLQLLHERGIPLFSLAQVIAHPDAHRGALVLMRARIDARGVVEEMRLIGSTREVPVAAMYQQASRTPNWTTESRSTWLELRNQNLDVPSGQRALSLLPLDFADGDDVVVLLARFVGLREGDLWPQVQPLAAYHPGPRLVH